MIASVRVHSGLLVVLIHRIPSSFQKVGRRYIAKLLPIWRKTQNNQSINQPINPKRGLLQILTEEGIHNNINPSY